MAYQHVATMTDLAQIYTHPKGPQHAILKLPGPLKSGITPLTPPPYRNRYQWELHENLKRYQMGRFWDFTAEEIHLSEAFAPFSTATATGTLNNPIHPMLQRHKWERHDSAILAPYPLFGGRDGYWDPFQNDVVWDLIYPCLQLASMFLSNLQTWPWFDALFNGEYQNVPDEQLPPNRRGHEWQTFKLRPPHVSGQLSEHQKLQEIAGRFSDLISFSINSGYADTETGLEGLSPQHGETNGFYYFPDRNQKGILVSFSFEMFQPLFETRLTEADRAITIFRAASTIMHELSHAFWICAGVHGFHQSRLKEPFFEDERISELGFSMENAVFRGLPQEFFQDITVQSNGLPPMGEYLTDFNKYHSEIMSTMSCVLLNPPPNYYVADTYPIPCQYFVDIQNDQWWNVTKRLLGALSTAMPRIYGKRIRSQPGHPSNIVQEVITPPKEEIAMRDNFTQNQRTHAMQINNRRRRDNQVRAAMLGYMNRAQPPPPPPPQPANNDEDVDMDSDEYSSEEEIQSEAEAEDEDDKPVPACPRYEEIKRYLNNQRQPLALDTMRFKIPEHILLKYIHVNGGINITALEWRNFLLNCDGLKDMFRITHKFGRLPTPYHLIVVKARDGWSTNPLPPINRPYITFTRHQYDCFVRVANQFLDRKPPFMRHDFWDADIERFRYECNWILGTDPNGQRLNADVFEAIINSGAHPRFILGPKGVVRRLRAAPVQHPPRPQRRDKRPATDDPPTVPNKHPRYKSPVPEQAP